MTTLTAARVSELPRINLLPPEIAAASQLKRLQALLALLVLGALMFAALLYFWANGQVGTAQDQLTDAEAVGAQRQAEVASYAEVPRVLASVDAAEAGLVEAMAPEVRWSFYLNDLSLTIPSSVRLTSLTATNAAAQAQITPEPIAPVTSMGVPSIGTVEFAGKARNFDAVAAWLQSLGQEKGYREALLASVAEQDEPTVSKVYEFSTTASVDTDALSMRFAQVLAAGE